MQDNIKWSGGRYINLMKSCICAEGRRTTTLHWSFVGIAGHFLETLGSLARCFLDESNFEILRILSLECIMKPLFYCCLGESLPFYVVYCGLRKLFRVVSSCWWNHLVSGKGFTVHLKDTWLPDNPSNDSACCFLSAIELRMLPSVNLR